MISRTIPSASNLPRRLIAVASVPPRWRRTPFAVISEITARPDPKTQVKVEFRHLANIQDEEVGTALMERHESVYDFLAVPYQPNTEGDKPAEGKAKGSKKF